MRIVDRETAKVVAGFQSTRRANCRLLQLTRAGFLRRFFVGSIAHGRKAVYTLSAKGANLVNARFGGIHRPSDRLVVGDRFVEHQSGINQIYLALNIARLRMLALVRWLTFSSRYLEAIKLTPDGYFELQQNGGAVRAMFLEVDLGTEALQVWQQKTAYYLQLALSGDFQKRFHQQQFRVLVVSQLRAAASQHPHRHRQINRQDFLVHNFRNHSPRRLLVPCLAPANRRSAPLRSKGKSPCAIAIIVIASRPGEPLFCNFCGRSYDLKLCPHRHPNPRNAEVCSQCGSRDLSTPHPRTPLWLAPLTALLTILPGLLLVTVSVLFVAGLIRTLLVNQQLMFQAVLAGLMLAFVWYLFMHFLTSCETCSPDYSNVPTPTTIMVINSKTSKSSRFLSEGPAGQIA